MFSFLTGKTYVKNSKLIVGCTDIHSHLLPGVDDGATTFEEARRAISALEEVGVKQMFLTPHIAGDLPNNLSESLQARFNEFLQECPSSIQFKLAGEYMLDNNFVDKISNKALTYDGRHLLVETSYIAAPNNFENLMYEIQLRELVPVLAHPERYLYQSFNELRRLKRIGVKFQLNLFSLSGAYGNVVRDMALDLLNIDAYDYVGTDIHRITAFNASYQKLKLSKSIIAKIEQLFENNQTLFNP